MVYAYIRYSTDRQDEQQQINIIHNYLSKNNMQVDSYVYDKGISGGKSYKDRSLFQLVQNMKEGDTLIVSEVSRIGRSMSDLNKLVSDELKPRKTKLIVVSMNLELDCYSMKAIDEMILFSFSFGAQLEREMIKDRVKSALEARKKSGKEIGGTKNLWGRKTNADRTIVVKLAASASAEARREKAKNNNSNQFFWNYVSNQIRKNGGNIDFDILSDELNSLGQTTSTGLDFTPLRARAMYNKLKEIYRYERKDIE